MYESSSGIDDAWERVVQARAQSNPSAEALALSLLAQALHEDGRTAEAFEVGKQGAELTRSCPDSREILLSRFRALTAHGAKLELAAGPKRYDRPAQERQRWHRQLSKARHAYDGAYSALMELGDAPQELIDEAQQRLAAGRPEEARRGGTHPGGNNNLRSPAPVRPQLPSLPSLPSLSAVEAIFVGFVAVKVLGPFLEEWAKKLGEQLGESTVRALGRIRLRRRSRSDSAGGELDVDIPDAPAPTTLVIPRQLSDEARLAILDLDPSDDAIRGAKLHWIAMRRMWIPEQELEADESLNDWEVRYTWAVAEGTNGRPRHTYDRAPNRSEAFRCGMRAHRDAPYLIDVHIRRAYEEDWGAPVRPIPPRPVPPDLNP